MNCPNCFHKLQFNYLASRGKKFSCKNRECPVKKTGYGTNLIVKDDWWFAYSYDIAFKFENEWYYIAGPYSELDINTHLIKEYTHIYRLNQFEKFFIPNSDFKIPYRALPTNDDFLPEFNKLIDRAFNHWRLLI